MKYQVRIKDMGSDRPASEVFDNYADAVKRLEEVRQEIIDTWAMPDPRDRISDFNFSSIVIFTPPFTVFR